MLSRYGGYSSSSGSLFSFRSARARINTSNQNSHNNYWHFKNYDGGNTRPRPSAPPQPARPALSSSSGVDPGLVTTSSASTRVNPADWAQVGASTMIINYPLLLTIYC